MPKIVVQFHAGSFQTAQRNKFISYKNNMHCVTNIEILYQTHFKTAQRNKLISYKNIMHCVTNIEILYQTHFKTARWVISYALCYKY